MTQQERKVALFHTATFDKESIIEQQNYNRSARLPTAIIRRLVTADCAVELILIETGFTGCHRVVW